MVFNYSISGYFYWKRTFPMNPRFCVLVCGKETIVKLLWSVASCRLIIPTLKTLFFNEIDTQLTSITADQWSPLRLNKC